MASAEKTLIKRSLRTLDLELKRVPPPSKPAQVYENLDDAVREKNSGGHSAYLCPLSGFCTFNGFSFDQHC